MWGYRLMLVDEETRRSEDLARRTDALELAHLRMRSRKFEAELSDLRKLAGEKGRALELLSEHVKDARLLAQEAGHRADVAERMVQMQDKSIGQLMASNDRMVGLVADMRRVGFGILEPIEVNDTPKTTGDYDREAVEQNRELEADGE